MTAGSIRLIVILLVFDRVKMVFTTALCCVLNYAPMSSDVFTDA